MVKNNIDSYKIIRVIGEGGMSKIYEAENLISGNKVALKLYKPKISTSIFNNEVAIMTSLKHHNITRLIDYVEDEELQCIMMELLEGQDLDQKIKYSGPLSEIEFLEIFTQALNALNYIHKKEIIHCDIKPTNIFILTNGQVKILDFGNAKSQDTQTHTKISTAAYMSPEQVKSDINIDNRSDIYSLGVTMYYAINGKALYNPLFDSQNEIFSKIVNEPLSIFKIESPFIKIILKACAKNSENRFQCCEDFIKELSFVTLA
jgi:serine/threonine-protein kinase